MTHRDCRGVALLWFVLLLFILIAFAALAVDYGGALATKTQAIAASENAGHAALAELWIPDYVLLGADPTSDADWDALMVARYNAARTAAQARGNEHAVGYSLEVRNMADTPVPPDGDDIVVRVTNPSEHFPNLQLNAMNDPDGDIVVGHWPWMPDAVLPRAVRVYVRRTPEPAVADTRDGDNPIPMTFARASTVNEWDDPETGTQVTSFAHFRNRGIRLETFATVAMHPARAVPAGTTMSDGTRVGLMPLAVRLSALPAGWFTTPSTTHVATIGTNAFVYGDGSTWIATGAGAPPTALTTGVSLVGADPTTFLADASALVGTTWTVAAVDATDVCVGFLRVYGATVTGSTVTLRPAPSGVLRVRTAMSGPVPDGALWASGVVAQPYGVASVPVTVEFRQVEP
jgi:hypothetical protein